MTRGKVLLIGLAVLLLGGLGQVCFQAAGFEGFSAGIAAEALLVVIVVVWTSSYLFRVVTGPDDLHGPAASLPRGLRQTGS